MKKKILVTVIFLITALSMLMCGCERKHGEFYTLEEAYNNGLLTKENLEEIAYYVNDQLKYPEELDSKVEKKIKNDMAYDFRHRTDHAVKEAKAEGFMIFAFYGEYSGSYIVRIRDIYIMTTAYIPHNYEEVGGVDFYYTGHYRIKIWKDN